MKTEIVASQKELNEWRNRITSAYQKSVASVIEVGKLVKQAKERLGVSYELLVTELPFSASNAAYFVKIAEHPVLSNPQYHHSLPSAYNTLYYLAGVEEGELIEQIESGQITPNFSLHNSKVLRETSPKKSATTNSKQSSKASKVTYFEVGTIAISAVNQAEAFGAELSLLLEKYKGTLTVTHRENSLAEWHRKQLHEIALEKIKKAEGELKDISLEQIRMIEEAAHFLQKDKSQKHKREIVLDGELVFRTCIPQDYKDFAKLKKLLGQADITRGFLRHWCRENKVPTQFNELKSMNKEFYVWEQVRLITEKKDVKGATKRLKDLSSRSTIAKIKTLAGKALEEVTRFDKKV